MRNAICKEKPWTTTSQLVSLLHRLIPWRIDGKHLPLFKPRKHWSNTYQKAPAALCAREWGGVGLNVPLKALRSPEGAGWSSPQGSKASWGQVPTPTERRHPGCCSYQGWHCFCFYLITATLLMSVNASRPAAESQVIRLMEGLALNLHTDG